MKKNAAILITAYNRYENFKVLFNFIKFYKGKIYISIDGPKNNSDKIEQAKIINLIKKKKNRIQYRILDKNLGCQKANLSSFDWFFLHEEKGIILEDDTLPSLSFFLYCNELLVKFSKNKKIFSISGYNPFKKININEDYFFSENFMCWGWATWRSRWLIAKKFTKQNNWTELLKTKKWNYFLDCNIKKRYLNKIYHRILLNKIDSWAFLWLLIGIANNSKFILPKYNLVKNTGTNTMGANNVPSKFDYTNSKIANYRIKHHPSKNNYNQKLDLALFNLAHRPKNALYPWRIVFLIKCLLFDPKFFLLK